MRETFRKRLITTNPEQNAPSIPEKAENTNISLLKPEK